MAHVFRTQSQVRVEQYFDYVWLCHKGLLDKDNYFFDELPLPLHLECAEYLHTEIVETTPLFENCSRHALRRRLPPRYLPASFAPRQRYCTTRRAMPDALD